MSIWPWSTIARLERENQKLQSQLATEKFMRELSEVTTDAIISARRAHVEGLWPAVVAIETIADQVTPGANGTVKKMARIAVETRDQIRKAAPQLYERLKATGGKATPYDQEAPEVSANG